MLGAYRNMAFGNGIETGGKDYKGTLIAAKRKKERKKGDREGRKTKSERGEKEKKTHFGHIVHSQGKNSR